QALRLFRQLALNRQFRVAFFNGGASSLQKVNDARGDQAVREPQAVQMQIPIVVERGQRSMPTEQAGKAECTEENQTPGVARVQRERCHRDVHHVEEVEWIGWATGEIQNGAEGNQVDSNPQGQFRLVEARLAL